MSTALNATGRPILFSICNWGEDYPWLWASTIANSWRMSGDIWDTFDKYDVRCPCEGPDSYACQNPNGIHCSVTNILNQVSFIARKGRPGAWNDLDMLEVGNGAMSESEYVAHFSMWSAVKSPLIMGNDLRIMTPEALTILNNPAVIAINQDPLGVPAGRRWIYPADDTGSRGEIQLWSGKLTSTSGGTYNDMVVLLVNGGLNTLVMNATLLDIFDDFAFTAKSKLIASSWEVRDLWAGRMSLDNATRIINGTAASNSSDPYAAWYNATETSYAKGLAMNNSLLLGSPVTTVEPTGTVLASVEAHGAAIFRLRYVAPSGAKDEL
jgi:alpha-galactosidase